MWLAKAVYEPLPAICIVLGGSMALFGYHSEIALVQTLAVPIGVITLTGGLVLVLRRRSYRSSRSRSRYDEHV